MIFDGEVVVFFHRTPGVYVGAIFVALWYDCHRQSCYFRFAALCNTPAAVTLCQFTEIRGESAPHPRLPLEGKLSKISDF